jgi:hypothetical protein
MARSPYIRPRATARLAAVAAAVQLAATTLLAGCGGGGGTGTAAPPAPLPVSLTPTPGSVSATASVNSSAQQIATVSIAITNATVGLALGGSATSNGIASAAIEAVGGSLGRISIDFKAPNTLQPGTYQDTITAFACANVDCTTAVSGTTITVPVTCVVTPVAATAAPTVTIAPLALNYQGVFFSVGVGQDPYDPAPAPVVISFANFGVTPNVTFSYSRNGLNTVAYASTGTTQGTLTPTFQPPLQIGTGQYNDTISLSVCLDAGCVNPVAGSPFTIPVTYTVGNTYSVSGAAGYTMTFLQLSAADIAWDPQRSVLYVSQAPISQLGTTITAVTTLLPATGTTGAAVTLASAPATLAISDDQSFLYVSEAGTVQRLLLPALTPDISLPLGSTFGGGGLWGGDMRVMPGAPHTLLVACSIDAVPQQASGLLIFDDATPRGPALGASTQPPFVSTLEFGATTSALYGGTIGQPYLDLYALSISSSGAQLVSDTQHVGSGRLHYANALLYTDDGKVYDPATQTVVGHYPGGEFVTGVLPDATLGRIFAVVNADTITPVVQVFDSSFTNLLATAPLSYQFENVTRMVRFGSNGLAIVTDSGYVILIQGAFVTG